MNTAAATGGGRTGSSAGISNEGARTIFNGNAAEKLVECFAW